MQVLKAIADVQPRPINFPTLEDRSRKDDTIDRMFIIMTLLGESLADIKRRLPGGIFRFIGTLEKCLFWFVFSLNTGFYCAVKCLDAIQQLHASGFVHRDVKPANFVLGLPKTSNSNVVYMVDFGIARKCVDQHRHMLTPRGKVC